MSVLVLSCGPSDKIQTVSFVLTAPAHISGVDLVIAYDNGRFIPPDGGCRAGGAVSSASDATLSVAVGLDDSVVQTTTTSTSSSSSSMPPQTTTTTHPTTTTHTTTTTVATNGTCGNAKIDRLSTTICCEDVGTPVGQCSDGNTVKGEECDDGNTENGDGCDHCCQIETPEFSSVDNGVSALRIHIVDGGGIASGTTLAVCKFQGDISGANLQITATKCQFPDGKVCAPEIISVTTVTTTTTTTSSTSSTTTTTTPGQTTTT
jgi:cysteine-rich repeat protein